MFNQPNKQIPKMTNSFRTFFQDLQNQTKNKFKNFSQPHYYSQQVPNQKFHGESWDVNHMDNFLNDQNWSNTPSKKTRSTIYKETMSKKYQETASHNRSQTPTIQLASSYKTQTNTQFNNMQQTNSLMNLDLKPKSSVQGARSSFFFTNVSRNPDTKENFQVRDYSDQYCNRNFLIERDIKEKGEQYIQNADKYYNENFTSTQKTYEADKLDMVKRPATLQLPSEKLKELKEVKQNQLEYKKWKQEELFKHKKYRIHQNEYKSGILQVDSPFNPQSDLYKQDSQNLNRLERAQQNKMKEKQQLIKRNSTTNGEIEFFNKNLLKQTKQSYKYDKMNPIWKNKKRVDLPQYENSQKRLFGEDVEKPKTTQGLGRELNIRNNDVRGRGFNFLGYNENTYEKVYVPKFKQETLKAEQKQQ